jgi:hypothetical protein
VKNKNNAVCENCLGDFFLGDLLLNVPVTNPNETASRWMGHIYDRLGTTTCRYSFFPGDLLLNLLIVAVTNPNDTAPRWMGHIDRLGTMTCRHNKFKKWRHSRYIFAIFLQWECRYLLAKQYECFTLLNQYVSKPPTSRKLSRKCCERICRSKYCECRHSNRTGWTIHEVGESRPITQVRACKLYFVLIAVCPTFLLLYIGLLCSFPFFSHYFWLLLIQVMLCLSFTHD